MALDRLSAAAARAVDEYYERCRAAEQHLEQEAHAAVVLQSCWRGRLQRQELQRLNDVAVTIQRCWRGYLGRQRFAAALSALNTQLRRAYFHHQATVMQKCWRGYFSRSRVHDFYKRKAYLSAVAAANTAVRAGMAAELQEALARQQQQQQQAAKQHFDAQVSRLHHLASTSCRPGIFGPAMTAAGAVREPPAVAGQPLEQHFRAAAKQQAAGAVRQQQGAIRQAMRSSTAGLTLPAAPQRQGQCKHQQQPQHVAAAPALLRQEAPPHICARRAGPQDLPLQCTRTTAAVQPAHSKACLSRASSPALWWHLWTPGMLRVLMPTCPMAALTPA
ncbi:hypothetical protein COO60DRAFT_91972 [Scenedesmus sp. NREL 46B-D3]|nr:hypothetical protein COO60DRAFT_91972 [Scenedesmus sp. NREL 46B-D3]